MLGCVFVTLQAVEFSIHISMYYILISLMLEICYSRIKTHEIWCIIFSLLMVGLRHGKIFLCSSFFFFTDPSYVEAGCTVLSVCA